MTARSSATPPDDAQTRGLDTEAPDPAPEEGQSTLELEVVLRGPPRKVVVARAVPKPEKERRKTTSTGKDDKAGDDVLLDEEPDASAAPPPPPPPPPGDVALSASTVRLGSSVEPDAVRSVLEQNRAIFRVCSEADASVALDVTITPSGEVGDVTSSASEPDDVRLRDCVVSAFRKLRFPPIASTESAKVRLRLALRRD